MTPPSKPTLTLTTSGNDDQPTFSFTKDEDTKLYLIKLDEGESCETSSVSDVINLEVEVVHHGAEISNAITTLHKCASCHKGGASASTHPFAENIPSTSAACQDKLEYLQGISTPYITSGDLCNSRIYTSLENATFDTSCANHAKVTSVDAWMSGYAGADTDDITHLKTLIETGPENMNCPSAGALLVDTDTSGEINLNSNEDYFYAQMSEETSNTFYAVAVDLGKNISTCSDAITYNNDFTADTPSISIDETYDSSGFTDNGVYITSKKEVKFNLGDLENGGTLNIYSVDEEEQKHYLRLLRKRVHS